MTPTPKHPPVVAYRSQVPVERDAAAAMVASLTPTPKFYPTDLRLHAVRAAVGAPFVLLGIGPVGCNAVVRRVLDDGMEGVFGVGLVEPDPTDLTAIFPLCDVPWGDGVPLVVVCREGVLQPPERPTPEFPAQVYIASDAWLAKWAAASVCYLWGVYEARKVKALAQKKAR